MRLLAAILFLGSIIFACSSSKKAISLAPVSLNQPDTLAGLAVVTKSDCLICHKVDERIQGPSYRDIANKYAGMPDTIVKQLANKIIGGGMGVWGEIPMVPHHSMTQKEAEAVVKYILSLKK